MPTLDALLPLRRNRPVPPLHAGGHLVGEAQVLVVLHPVEAGVCDVLAEEDLRGLVRVVGAVVYEASEEAAVGGVWRVDAASPHAGLKAVLGAEPTYASSV